MADYQLMMMLIVQQSPYRQIDAVAGCSHHAIPRARRALDAERSSTHAQIEALTPQGYPIHPPLLPDRPTCATESLG